MKILQIKENINYKFLNRYMMTKKICIGGDLNGQIVEKDG
ncbi:hypothetical protein BJAB0715_02037 [Acinetobacter baumannii BJAB0715]|nr:hypothetical protein BJAB0715_02037 [Acinetobacter baumannii BJAB0715]